MVIRFLCPFGHKLVVAEERAGKKGRCPKCQQRVIVPVEQPHPSGKEKRPAWRPPARRRKKPSSAKSNFSPADSPKRVLLEKNEVQPQDSSPWETVFLDEEDKPSAKPTVGSTFSSVEEMLPPPAIELPIKKTSKGHAKKTSPSIPHSYSQSFVQYPPSVTGFEKNRLRSLRALVLFAWTIAMVGTFPALPHANLSLAPIWARILWMHWGIAMIWGGWIFITPDWRTARLGSFAWWGFSLLFTLQAGLLGVVPNGRPVLWGLDSSRLAAAIWCLLTAMLWFGVGFVFRTFALNWQKAIAAERN